MEGMAGSSEFLAKYVGGSVQEMGAFAIHAAKSGVSLQTIEQSMKGALDWESSITKEMEASVLLGKQISLDKFRELSFNEDATGALNEQMRILRSLGPLDQLRLDQKEALGDMFGMEFTQLVALQRQQDILNNSTSKNVGLWADITGGAITFGGTLMGFMPGILAYGSQLSMMFGKEGLGGAIKALGGHLATAGKAMGRFALKALMGAGALLVKAVVGIWDAFAAIPYGLGIPLAIGAVAGLYKAYNMAKSKAPKGKAKGGPVKGMNPYMVGEKGPELFIPTMGGNIIPNDRLAGGTADRVYGDTSKQDAKFDTMIGLLQQANTDRNDGNRKGLMGIEGLRGM
jgi:hypothetical protein